MKNPRLVNRIEYEACLVAGFICTTGSTIRQTAHHLGMTKSTVHNRIERTLCKIDSDRYQAVRKILDEHYSERGLRGAAQRTYNARRRKDNGR